MDLIENHQAILIGLEKKFRVGEFVAIGSQFEVQIERIGGLRDLPGQRCFANLTRPDEHHPSLPVKTLLNNLESSPRNHSRILQTEIGICKDTTAFYLAFPFNVAIRSHLLILAKRSHGNLAEFYLRYPCLFSQSESASATISRCVEGVTP